VIPTFLSARTLAEIGLLALIGASAEAERAGARENVLETLVMFSRLNADTYRQRRGTIDPLRGHSHRELADTMAAIEGEGIPLARRTLEIAEEASLLRSYLGPQLVEGEMHVRLITLGLWLRRAQRILAKEAGANHATRMERLERLRAREGASEAMGK